MDGALFETLKPSIVTVTGPDRDDYGQGVLIRPDLLLTARHVVAKAALTVHNIALESAAVIDSPGSRFDPLHDIALVRIARPLSSQSLKYAADESGLDDMKATLLTRFNAKAMLEADDVKASPARKQDEFAKWDAYLDRRSFCAELFNVRAGYSGSPIFNERGEVASLVSSGNFISENGVELWRHPEKSFGGVLPSALSRFLKNALG